MTKFTKRKRLEATIAGEKTDRTPVAMWRHWPGDDQDAKELALSVLQWQKEFDWDLVKHSPSSSYMVMDYGMDDRWVGHIEGTREYTVRPVVTAEDWLKLKPLDPSKGQLATQIESLKLLGEGLDKDTPFVATVFAPLSQAKNLAGNEHMISLMRSNPQELHSALEVITESTLRFLEEAKKTGIDGIYYAIQHNRYPLMNKTEFREFGRYYDDQVLAAVDDLWLNILHVHSLDIMFDEITDYPVQIINWHDRDTAPSLKEGLSMTDKAASGGISQWTLHQETPDNALAEAKDAIEQSSGKRLLLGTGCVTMTTTPKRNLRAIRAFVEN